MCVCPAHAFLSPAQDRPSHQHLLQCGEAPLAAGQCGWSPPGGPERARPVWHGGLLDHLGKCCTLCDLRRLFCCPAPGGSQRFIPPVPDGGQQRRGPLYWRDKRQSHHALQHSHHGLGLWTLQVGNTDLMVQTISAHSTNQMMLKPTQWPLIKVLIQQVLLLFFSLQAHFDSLHLHACRLPGKKMLGLCFWFWLMSVAPNTAIFTFLTLLLSSPLTVLACFSSGTLTFRWKSFPPFEAPQKSMVTWWVESTASQEWNTSDCCKFRIIHHEALFIVSRVRVRVIVSYNVCDNHTGWSS